MLYATACSAISPDVETKVRKVRSLLTQTTHTLGSMAGNQGLQIAAGIALARVYGPAGKGLVTYAGIAILGVVAIADGLGSTIARQCGTGEGDTDAAYAAAVRIVLTISAAGVVFLVPLGLLLPAQHALLYVGIAFPFALYAQAMSGFHLIALRVGRTNIASLVINGGAALAMLVITLTARPPIDVILGLWAAGYIAGAAIIFQGLARRPVDATALRLSLLEQINFAIRASSASLMTFLASRVDVFIIAATLSATALGNYTLALACGELMWHIGRAMSWSAYGRVATSTITVAAELAAKITRIVLAVEAGAALIAFLFGPSLIAFVYGPAFADAGSVLRILIPGMALYAGDAILTYFLSVRVGRPGVILRIEALTFVVCAIGSLVTVAHFGMIGPAVATTIAYSVSFTVKAMLFSRATGTKLYAIVLIHPSDFRPSRAPIERSGVVV